MDPAEATIVQQAMGLVEIPFDTLQMPFGRMPATDASGGACRTLGRPAQACAADALRVLPNVPRWQGRAGCLSVPALLSSS